MIDYYITVINKFINDLSIDINKMKVCLNTIKNILSSSYSSYETPSHIFVFFIN